MAIAATETNRVTHHEAINCKKQVYAATLAISGAAEVGSLAINGGGVQIPGVRQFRGVAAAASIATVGAATYTIANLVTGTIVRDCAGASRTDVLPTAALAVAGLTAAFGVAPAVGDCLDCLIVNGSDPVTEIITIDAGTGGTWDANQTAVSRTILGTDRALVRLRFTVVAGGSESYVVYM